MKLTKKRILIGGISGLLALCAFFVWLMGPMPRAFDSKEWATCKDHSRRIAMLDDLQRKHHLVGMTREQVIQLLGQPDTVHSAEQAKSDRSFMWDLGVTVGTDDNYFYVNFDGDKPDDKVKSITISQN